MNYSTHKLTLDVAGSGVQRAITLRRGESAHALEVSFTDGGKPYTITQDCTAMFAAAKPDDTQILNTCTISENRVIAEITPQTTAVIGRVDCEIRLYGVGEMLIIAPRFCIFVEETAIDEDGVASSDEYSALDELIGRAQNAISAGLITAAEATVDAHNGTPSVEVHQENITGGKKLVFAFSGLKGDTGIQGVKGDTGNKGDKGDKGDTGESGVYVGSDPIPEGYNVQIDPDGSADELVTEAPNDGQQYARKNKAWAIVQGGGSGTGDHTELSNRDAADQHPVSAITGLSSALNNKLDKAQGASHAGEFLVVGSDGEVTTQAFSVLTGGSY
ncbi:MAG: BppU family phage baseplate upper protein [Eubacteriales bacterium]|nr:BppU family phage baseplate upper protein [Eubacteriales bacterium]